MTFDEPLSGPALRAELARIAARPVRDLPAPEPSRRESDGRERMKAGARAGVDKCKAAIWAGAKPRKPKPASRPRTPETAAEAQARRAARKRAEWLDRNARRRAELAAAREGEIGEVLSVMRTDPARLWLSRDLAAALALKSLQVAGLLQWMVRDGRVRRVPHGGGVKVFRFALEGAST